MRDTDLPTKTTSGRNEVANRQLRLKPQQRVLLIAIRGEQTLGEIRQQFRVLGDVDTVVRDLIAAGLIVADRSSLADNQTVAESMAESVPDATAVDHGGVYAVIGARQFMNETVLAVLGLRAFLFTLKVERCHTQQDALDLLPEYHRVLAKAKGAQFAEAMVRNVEKLLAEK
ncbi:MAG: hypothetical protein ABIR62_02705 [Dokdonella sp.]|uniref:hypothetical protein n=1 Tax=Dokdonella sp. TaxID=2291710 RepID=UPI003267EA72